MSSRPVELLENKQLMKMGCMKEGDIKNHTVTWLLSLINSTEIMLHGVAYEIKQKYANACFEKTQAWK